MLREKPAYERYFSDLLDSKKEQLEDFLGKEQDFDFYLIMGFATKPTLKYQEKTIDYLESKLGRANFMQIFAILIHYAANYDDDGRHIEFISSKLSNYAKPVQYINFGTSFSKLYEREATLTPQFFINLNTASKEIFNKLESYKEHQDTVKIAEDNYTLFIAMGAADELYYPDFALLPRFKKLIESQEDIMIQAITRSLLGEIQFSKRNMLDIVDEVNFVRNYSKENYNLLVEEIVKKFVAKPTDNLESIRLLVNSNNNMPHNEGKDIIPTALEIVKYNNDDELVKGSVSILTKLFKQHFTFEQDALKHFSRFLSSSDNSLLNLTLRTYATFSEKLTISEQDLSTLFDLAHNNYKYWHIFLEIFNNAKFSEDSENNKKLTKLKKDIDDFIIRSNGDRLDSFKNILTDGPAKLTDSSIEDIVGLVNILLSKKMGDNKWFVSDIELLASIFKNENVPAFIRVVDYILNYKIPNSVFNSDGDNALAAMLHNVPEDWLEAIIDIHNENNYKVAKTREGYLNEIFELNSHKPEIKRYVDKIRDQLLEIDEIDLTIPKRVVFGANSKENHQNSLSIEVKDNEICYESKHFNGKLTGKTDKEYNKLLTSNLKKLTKTEKVHLSHYIFKELIKQRSEELKAEISKDNDSSKYLPKIVSLEKFALHVTTLKGRNYVRDSQVIAALLQINSEYGMILEIATGEGKTIINDLFTAYKAFTGMPVDIVSSSKELVRRDVTEQSQFFNLLNIEVGSTYGLTEADGSKPSYSRPVVFGDMLSYVGDELRDLANNAKNSRECGILSADELDAIFIDESVMKVLLSSPIPGFEHLTPLNAYLWSHLMLYVSNLKYTKDGMYFIEQRVDSDEVKDKDKLKEELLNENVPYVEEEGFYVIKYEIGDLKQVIEYLTSKLSDYMNENFIANQDGGDKKREEKLYIEPNWMTQFVKDELPRWIESAINAHLFIPKKDYLLESDPDTHLTNVSPLDYARSGSIQSNLRWDSGLHQFLQIKHGVAVTPEGLTSTFMSYVNYILKYKGRIYGLTGTVGDKAHQEFIERFYGAEVVKLPNHIDKKYTEFEAISSPDTETWLKDIVSTAKKTTEIDRRAVMIIANTVASIEMIGGYLIESGYSKEKIRFYGDSQNQASIAEPLKVGEVLVATTMAGRGTDVKLSPEVAKAGGIHLIITFFPTTERTEKQLEGRVARNGDMGSSQFIIDLSQYEHKNDDPLPLLISDREKYEAHSLNALQYCVLPDLMLADELFSHHIQKVRTITSPINLKVQPIYDHNDLAQDITGTVFIYAKDKEIFIDAVSDRQTVRGINITQIIKITNVNVYNHMLSILSNPHNAKSTLLNHLDYEMINFVISLPQIEAKVVKDSNEVESAKLDMPSELDGISKNDAAAQRVQRRYTRDWLIEEGEGFAAVISALTSDIKEEIKYLRLRILGPEKNSSEHEIKIPREELIKTKLQLLFSYWLEDNAAYRPENVQKQLDEIWAKQLKNHMSDLRGDNDCADANYNEYPQAERNRAERKERLIKGYDELFDVVLDKDNLKNLFTNPAYLIFQGFQFLKITDFQSQNLAVRSSGNIVQSIDAAMFGAWGNPANFVEQKVDNIIPGSISVTGNNVYLENGNEKAIESMDKAILKDLFYSAPPENGLAYAIIVDCSNRIIYTSDAQGAAECMQKAITHLSNAWQRVYESWYVPKEQMYTALRIQGIIEPQSELSKQMLTELALFKEIMESYRRNIEIIANNSDGNSVAINRVYDGRAYLERINVTALVNATSALTLTDIQTFLNPNFTAYNASNYANILDHIYVSGFVFFDVRMYGLEDEGSWLGDIFSAIIGIGEILVGIALVSMGGPFATSFGTSLVSMGMGDVFNTLVTVLSGYHVDVDSFLKSKPLAFAVAITLASIATFAHNHKILGFEVKDIKAADMEKFMYTMGAGTLAGYYISRAVYQASENYTDANDGAAESEARNEVAKLFERYQRQLRLIIAIDESVHSNQYQNELSEKAFAITQNYNKQFSKAGSKFIQDVGVGVAGMVATSYFGPGIFGLTNSVSGAAVNLAVGMYKYNEAADDFTKHFGYAIGSIAENTGGTAALMRNLLQNQYPNDAFAIIEVLRDVGLINDNNLDYNRCDAIDEADIGKYESRTTTIISYCNDVKNSVEGDVLAPRVKDMETIIQQILFNNLKGILVNNYNTVFRVGGDAFTHHLTESFVKAKYPEQPKKEQNKGGLGTPADEKTTEPAKDGGSGGSGGKNKQNDKAKQQQENREQEPVEPNPDNYKHGEFGRAADKTAAAIDKKLNDATDKFFEWSHLIGDSLNDFSEQQTEYIPEASQPIRDATNAVFEAVGTVVGTGMYYASKVVYASLTVDGLNCDSTSVLMSDVNRANQEFDNGAKNVAKFIVANTTPGERRLVELALNVAGFKPALKTFSVSVEFAARLPLKTYVVLQKSVSRAFKNVATDTKRVVNEVVDSFTYAARQTAHNPYALVPAYPSGGRGVKHAVCDADDAFVNVVKHETKVVPDSGASKAAPKQLDNNGSGGGLGQPETPKKPKGKNAKEPGTDSNNDIDNNSPNSYNKNHDVTVGAADEVKLPNYKVKLEDFEKFKKQDGSGRYECERAESPLWKEFDSFREKYRTNGSKGRDRRYFRYDELHKDIEVYDGSARGLGSVDPVTGKLYRPGTFQVNKRLERLL